MSAVDIGRTVDRFCFGNGRFFYVVIYDLLAEPVDAIVNAANGNLSHGGGVAAAIAIAAGDELEREGRQIIDCRGPLKTGEAVITTAGRLPFKGVIHAVGPRMGEGNEKEKIVAALRSAFELAHSQGWQSVSFPGISSGIFSVPHEICAGAYFQAVQQFFEEHQESSLKTIRLCLFDGPLLKAVTNECARRHDELNNNALRCSHLADNEAGCVCSSCGFVGCVQCVRLVATTRPGKPNSACPPGCIDVSNMVWHYLCEKCAREFAMKNS